MHSYMYVHCRVFSPCRDRACRIDRSQMSVPPRLHKVQKFNDLLPFAKYALQTRLVSFGTSAEGSGERPGLCNTVRIGGRSSHSSRASAVRDHYQIWKSRPSKKRRNFRFPPSSPSTIFCSQLSPLSPIIGQSQSELTRQSSTSPIDLPFCCAVSIAIEQFHFLLIAYHAQRRVLSC